VPYLSALEACSRRGAIQIISFTFTLPYKTVQIQFEGKQIKDNDDDHVDDNRLRRATRELLSVRYAMIRNRMNLVS